MCAAPTSEISVVQDRVQSLLLLCCARIAENALQFDNMDYVADDLIMFICERAQPIQLAHLDNLFAVDRQQYSETNLVNWERICNERWTEELPQICAECAYDRLQPTYWKRVFLTASLRDVVEKTVGDPTDDAQRLIDLAADHVSVLSIRKVSLPMLQMLSVKMKRLRRLNFEGCDLHGAGYATAAARFVSRNVHLTTCNFAKTRIGEGAEAMEVLYAIRDHPSLIHANLTWCELNAASAKWVINTLTQSTMLKHLDIRWNPFLRPGRQILQTGITGLKRKITVLII